MLPSKDFCIYVETNLIISSISCVHFDIKLAGYPALMIDWIPDTGRPETVLDIQLDLLKRIYGMHLLYSPMVMMR